MLRILTRHLKILMSMRNETPAGYHAFLWFIMGSANLSATARSLIENPANEQLLSVASLWEIAIKTSLGRLTLSVPFDQLVPAQLQLNGIDLLNINVDHLSSLITLLFIIAIRLIG